MRRCLLWVLVVCTCQIWGEEEDLAVSIEVDGSLRQFLFPSDAAPGSLPEAAAYWCSAEDIHDHGCASGIAAEARRLLEEVERAREVRRLRKAGPCYHRSEASSLPSELNLQYGGLLEVMDVDTALWETKAMVDSLVNATRASSASPASAAEAVAAATASLVTGVHRAMELKLHAAVVLCLRGLLTLGGEQGQGTRSSRDSSGGSGSDDGSNPVPSKATDWCLWSMWCCANYGGRCAEEASGLIEPTPSQPLGVADVLWVAHSQLQGSYRSMNHSAASVSRFLSILSSFTSSSWEGVLPTTTPTPSIESIHRGRPSPLGKNDGILEHAAEGGGATGSSNLLRLLPIAPHWRLGFSGATGWQLHRGLEDWALLLRRHMGPTQVMPGLLGRFAPSTLSAHSTRSTHATHATHYPDLASDDVADYSASSHKPGETAVGASIGREGEEKRRVRVGFLSSWFCNSAVGRLMQGVVRELDRDQFWVGVFASKRLDGALCSDEVITPAYAAAADHMVILEPAGDPSGAFDDFGNGRGPLEDEHGLDTRGALEPMLRELDDASLDVLVFCDIGMEPLTYYLAFHRIAPVQVVFWGHPFTSGIPGTIDFYILPDGAEAFATDPHSQYELSDDLGSNILEDLVHVHPAGDKVAGAENHTDGASLALGRGNRYSEQLVRFETLGAVYDLIPSPPHILEELLASQDPQHPPFTETQLRSYGAISTWLDAFKHRRDTLNRLSDVMVWASDGAAVAPVASQEDARGGGPRLRLETARIYACLQHCGKFHPSLDEVLLGVLRRDPGGLLMVRDCRGRPGAVPAPSFQSRTLDGTGAGDSVEEALTNDVGLPDLDSTSTEGGASGPESRNDTAGTAGGLEAELMERIILVPELSLMDFMLLLGAAHVALEPFPFPASITSLDALAVGTPVVAHGATLGRIGLAQLTAALNRRLGFRPASGDHLNGYARRHYQQPVGADQGMVQDPQVRDCCIAESLEGLVRRAVRLATEPQYRKSVSAIIGSGLNRLFGDRESLTEWAQFLNSASKLARGSIRSQPQGPPDQPQVPPVTKSQAARDMLLRVSALVDCEASPAPGSSVVEALIPDVCATIHAHLPACAAHARADTDPQSNEFQNGSCIPALALQDLAGVMAVWSQREDPSGPRVSQPSQLGMVLAEMALELEPRLINAAFFGALSSVGAGAFDKAASFYATAARLKRPAFVRDTTQGHQHVPPLPGEVDSDTETGVPQNASFPLRRFSVGGRQGRGIVQGWESAAAADPMATAIRSEGPLGLNHPGTSIGDASIAFERIQYGVYNSAQPRHAGDQLRYLVQQGRLSSAFLAAADDYDHLARSMDAAMRGGERYRNMVDLGLVDEADAHPLIPGANTAERESGEYVHVRALQGRSLYLRPTPALSEGAVATRWFPGTKDPEKATKGSAGPTSEGARAKVVTDFEDHGVAVVDRLLSPRALAELEAFCVESTMFHRSYIQGYVGAFLGDGFGAAGLLHQVAAEVRQAFPEILGGRRLVQAWAYKYDPGHSQGIDPHADAATVSVNLWVTPDTANADPRSGGLIIYPEAMPSDWTFDEANAATAHIRSHLAARFGTTDESQSDGTGQSAFDGSEPQSGLPSFQGKRPLRVAYRANRCIIFQGKLFHQTDKIDFHPGYRNRRINVTLLFD